MYFLAEYISLNYKNIVQYLIWINFLKWLDTQPVYNENIA